MANDCICRDELESSDESDMEVDDDLGVGSGAKGAKHDLMMKSEVSQAPGNRGEGT